MIYYILFTHQTGAGNSKDGPAIASTAGEQFKLYINQCRYVPLCQLDITSIELSDLYIFKKNLETAHVRRYLSQEADQKHHISTTLQHYRRDCHAGDIQEILWLKVLSLMSLLGLS